MRNIRHKKHIYRGLKNAKNKQKNVFFSNKFKKSFVNQKNTVLLHRFSPFEQGEEQKIYASSCISARKA
jgi:hypothetical protein